MKKPKKISIDGNLSDVLKPNNHDLVRVEIIRRNTGGWTVRRERENCGEAAVVPDLIEAMRYIGAIYDKDGTLTERK